MLFGQPQSLISISTPYQHYNITKGQGTEAQPSFYSWWHGAKERDLHLGYQRKSCQALPQAPIAGYHQLLN